jgi:putative restriction endonuclease
LVATLDALFDGGLISFADDGHILIAAHLAVEQGRLHLDPAMRLRTISAGHRPYLAYHRHHVY